MTDVLVCVKRVVDTTGEVVLTEGGSGVDGRYAGYTMSTHEECAVEIAVQTAAASGGAVTVLTVGGPEAVEQLRSALAVGCSAAVHIEADSGIFGPADVAREIAEVVRDHETDGRPQSLVLLGNDASDTGNFQVGIRLAYELDRPVVNGATMVRVEDDHVVAEVTGPDGHETYRVPLPAVVTVLEGGVEPRYPTVPGRMKAKKVEIETRAPSAEPRGPQRVRLLLPPPQPSSVQVLGKGAEAAPAVVDLFEQLGVVSR